MHHDTSLTVGGLRLDEYVTFDSDDNLVVVSAVIAAKLDRPYLSVSSAKSLLKCPAQFAADKALQRGFDLMGAAEIGTAAHTVMERLLLLPRVRRTEQAAARLLAELAHAEPEGDDVDYAKELGGDHARHLQWSSAVQRAYVGLFAIEDPTQVDLVATEMRVEGVELGGVPFMGFIDRVDYADVGGRKALRIIDYKTGKPQVGNRPDAYGDDHGEQVQCYAEAYEAMTGARPELGLLYYTQAGGGLRNVAVSATETRKAVKHLTEAWANLSSYRKSGVFPTRKMTLCGWCPVVNACPAAARAGLVDRKGGAPSFTELGMPDPMRIPRGGQEVPSPPTYMVTTTPQPETRTVTMTINITDEVKQQIAVGAVAAVGAGDPASPFDIAEQVRQKVVEMTVAAIDSLNEKSTIGRAIAQIQNSTPFPAVLVGDKKDDRTSRVKLQFRADNPGASADENGLEEISTEPDYYPSGAALIALARSLKGHRVLVYKEVEHFTQNGQAKKGKVVRHLVDLGLPRDGE